MLLKKFNPFTNDLIFIDGLWGSGKSVLSPIVSGMERVEKVKFEQVYEYICVLHHLKKISPDAASWMLNTYADLSQYNNLIGREVNLRWKDDSGFFNNPKSLRYIIMTPIFQTTSSFDSFLTSEVWRLLSLIFFKSSGLKNGGHYRYSMAEFGRWLEITHFLQKRISFGNPYLAIISDFEKPKELSWT